LDAFIDESYNETVGRYCIGAVLVPHKRVIQGIRVIDDFMMGKTFSWANAKPQQRRDFLDAAIISQGVDCVGLVGRPASRKDQNRVRATLVAKLLPRLHSLGVARATFHKRWPEVDGADHEVARQLVVGNVIPRAPTFEIQHLSGNACWLLWAADAVAGSLNREAQKDQTFVQQLGPHLTKIP